MAEVSLVSEQQVMESLLRMLLNFDSIARSDKAIRESNSSPSPAFSDQFVESISILHPQTAAPASNWAEDSAADNPILIRIDL